MFLCDPKLRPSDGPFVRAFKRTIVAEFEWQKWRQSEIVESRSGWGGYRFLCRRLASKFHIKREELSAYETMMNEYKGGIDRANK